MRRERWVLHQLPAATEGGETDYGQPATYGVITQDLRKLRNGADRPWETGRLGVKMPAGTGKWKYVPEGQGFGVAKAKAYFHQLDKWSAPPNLFDPFWRAKLHPFVRDELKEDPPEGRRLEGRADHQQWSDCSGRGGQLKRSILRRAARPRSSWPSPWCCWFP